MIWGEYEYSSRKEECFSGCRLASSYATRDDFALIRRQTPPKLGFVGGERAIRASASYLHSTILYHRVHIHCAPYCAFCNKALFGSSRVACISRATHHRPWMNWMLDSLPPEELQSVLPSKSSPPEAGMWAVDTCSLHGG